MCEHRLSAICMQVSVHSLVKFLVLYFSAENISNFCTIIFSQYWLEYRNTSKCNKSHRFLGLINRCISNDTAKALVSPFLFYSCRKCAVCVAKTRLYIRSRYNHCVLKTFHSLNIEYHFYNHYLKKCNNPELQGSGIATIPKCNNPEVQPFQSATILKRNDPEAR